MINDLFRTYKKIIILLLLLLCSVVFWFYGCRHQQRGQKIVVEWDKKTLEGTNGYCYKFKTENCTGSVVFGVAGYVARDKEMPVTLKIRSTDKSFAGVMKVTLPGENGKGIAYQSAIRCQRSEEQTITLNVPQLGNPSVICFEIKDSFGVTQLSENVSFSDKKNKEEESDADEIDTYQNFIKLIKKSVFERKYSFVLKYIDIQGIELASGERALLNFFSWIYFVPKFTQIMREEKKESVLNKNILLLIDEIDLYCHPLWQQKMLAFLIDELKNQYSDKKVQIIFTTHSPIILSDIPRSNVIFLKRENDRCKIDDNRLHSETFGANIYKLFNNAFFLGQKGQIGEFSRNKIQVIINKISPKLDPEEGAVYHEISKKEAAELEKEIVLIGEPIIRNKLYDMLYKCQYCLKEPQERKLEIYRKKLQKLEEEMRHDIH